MIEKKVDKNNYPSEMLMVEVSRSIDFNFFLVTSESGYIEGAALIKELLSFSKFFSETYKLTGSEIFVFICSSSFKLILGPFSGCCKTQ